MPDVDSAAVNAVVKQALVVVLDQDLPELSGDTQLIGELGLDSTSVIDLLIALEDSLGLQIDPDELTVESFATFGALTEYVIERLSVAQEPVS
jgi:acyl carrier protein